MTERSPQRPHQRPHQRPRAILPASLGGGPLTIDDLPPADTKRWVARRKAEVVAGVRSGLITLEEACRRYALSVDEFLSWQSRLDRHGLKGLHITAARRP